MSNPLFKGSGVKGLDPDLDEQMPAEQGAMISQMASQTAPPAAMSSVPKAPQAPAGDMPPEMPPPPTDSPLSMNPVSQERLDNASLSQYSKLFQKAGADRDREVQQLKEYMKNYSQMDQGTDYRPLAAFVGGLNHGNPQLLKAAEDIAPESRAKRAENMIASQQALTKLVGDNSQAKALAQLALGQQRNQFAQDRLGLQKDRLDLMTDREARSTVNNDKFLGVLTPRLEGAAKIGELINSARQGKVVSNQALLGQLNAEIARLETGSQSPGLNASEKTELLDKKAQLQAYIDSYTGNPQDAVSKGNLDASDKLVKELTGSYKKGIASRIATLRAGMTPQQQAIADAKFKSIKDTYEPRVGSFDEDHGGPAVGTIEDGHKFMGGDPSDPASWQAVP